MEFKLFQPLYIHEMGKRQNQEDSLYPNDGQATVDNRVFIVCDGMGGHDKGEVASAAVCQGLSRRAEALLSPDRPFTDDDFRVALAEAFDTLDRADTEHAGRMGTTMTFICLHRGGVLAAHIGDSRIYHLRPATGEVLYRSRDHSLVQQLYEMGEISYNEMATNPRKNVIMRAMQPYQDERVEPSFVHITDVRPGDYFYLCSDGMLEQMEDDEMLSIVGNPTLTEEQKVQEFIRRTVDNSDNHTAYLVKIQEVINEAGDEAYLNDEPEARRRNKALNDTRKDKVWFFRPDGTQSPSMMYVPTGEDEGFMVPEDTDPAKIEEMKQSYNEEEATEVPQPSAPEPDPEATQIVEPAPQAPAADRTAPQASIKAKGDDRRNLLVALAVLGLIAIGVVLWLMLKGSSGEEAADVDDEQTMEEVMDKSKSDMDKGFVKDGDRGDFDEQFGDEDPAPEADRQASPQPVDGDNEGPAGETPTNNNRPRNGNALIDTRDRVRKSIIDGANKEQQPGQ